jgi:hypothetical protein
MKRHYIATVVVLFSVFCLSAVSRAQQDDIKSPLKEKQVKISIQDFNKITLTEPVKKEKDFTFSVNPYLWTVATGGYMGLPYTEEYDFNRKFTDALSNLKMMFTLAGRFKYKSISLLYDIAYVKLNPEISIPVTNQDRYISGSATVEEFVNDLALAYRTPVENKSFQLDFYGGVRIWSMNNSMDLVTTSGMPFSTSKSETWVDPVFGAGLNYDFEKKWFTYGKLDIGGLGFASDFTSVFMWGMGYRFDEHFNTSLGLKTMYVNYDNGDFAWKVLQYGFLLSVGYRL